MKKLWRKVLAVALVGVLVGSVGCKDYDDDINKLNDRVDTLTATVDQLKALIDGGAVITNVQKGADGIVITLSDNSTYTLTNGKDGQPGQPGKDAAVWTIGDDGFWYKDDAKTDYKAVGINGEDGTEGRYYVPNAATGCFDIYKDGKFVESTDISWTTAAGVIAVYAGNELKLTNVDGYEGELVLTLGAQLGSVGFVPECVDSAFDTYPTTTDPFYHLASYKSEDKFVAATGLFIEQDKLNEKAWDKSNVVDFIYRLNPSDAYVEGANVAFIDRVVEKVSRAAGDAKTLLNVVAADFKTTEGEVAVKGTINASKLDATGKNNIAALQVWAGQNPVTSDYVYVTSKKIGAVLANIKRTTVGQAAVEFYNRTKSLKSSQDGEDDAFVKQFVGNVDAANKPAHFVLPYDDKSLDLDTLVALYSNDIFNYLEKSEKKKIDGVGFEGITYTFSKPAEYLANDDKKTNQQAYIGLDGSVVSLSSDYTTSAIGRKPIIRVDAMVDNLLIASAYIKLVVAPGTATPAEDHNIKINEDQNVDYRAIVPEKMIGEMGWKEVSKQLYDAENLTAATFWNAYKQTYNVKITIDGVQNPILNTNVPADQLFSTTVQGVKVQINLNPADETSAYVKVLADNTIKTDHTYAGGAVYTVEITILPNDENVHGQFLLTQKFTVKDSHPKYTFNPNYYFNKSSEYGQIEGVTSDDIIVVKGQIGASSNSWEMSSVVSEHFAKLEDPNNTGTFVNIFTYYTDNKITNVKNVADLEFDWTGTTKPTDVTLTTMSPLDYTVALADAMKTPYLVRNMGLTQVLVNGEKCPSNYDIVFVNPFVAGAAQGVSIQANNPGDQVVDIKPQVLVVDKAQSDAIYHYVTTTNPAFEGLALTEKATDIYRIAASAVKVTYAPKKDAAYNAFVNQLSNNTTFEISSDNTNGDANLGGVITWNNEGATLANDVTLTFIATVTFEDLSVVECEIPVVMKK